MAASIDFYKLEHLQDLSYDLGRQLKNTASVQNAIDRVSGGILPKAKPCTIFKNGQPVGFFLLDFGGDRDEISANEHSVLIRSLSVNPALQGRGIGREALSTLPEFLKKHFPKVDEIVLAVNENNPHARRLYKNLGYELLPRNREGRNGLQFLMSKKI